MNIKKLVSLVLVLCLAVSLAACGAKDNTPATDAPKPTETTAATEAPETTAATEAPETTEAPVEEPTEDQAAIDQAAADHVAELIDAIYVQTRNENTDAQCAEAKAAWDALTDE